MPSLLDVESYAQVHQLVSSIEGRLRPGLDGIDAIAACLPAGSMTGAPKQRATEILDALEGGARGLYAGAFGYLGRDGRVDLAMTIRSIVLDGRRHDRHRRGHHRTLGAGGGDRRGPAQGGGAAVRAQVGYSVSRIRDATAVVATASASPFARK